MSKNSILRKLNKFAPIAELMPSVVIVQQLDPFSSIYMSSRGLRELGISQEQLSEMGPDYLSKFFHFEDTDDYLHRLRGLLDQGNPEETFSFMQQVKLLAREDWVWHIGATRIFAQDKNGKPTHIVTIAIPIHEMKHIPNKAERMLQERNFLNINRDKFKTLGSRELQVLKLVALGKSSPEIAKELYISILTVKTHRRSIKQKLGISNVYEFTMYAHAFDLI